MENQLFAFSLIKIKPKFIDRAVLAQVAAESIGKINPESQDGKRWIRAIAKAVAAIENNPNFEYDLRTASLQIIGSKNDCYTANGRCQCPAYIGGQPCYHRAAARLIQRYLEIVQ